MRPRIGKPSELGPSGRPILSEGPDIVPVRRDWIARAVLIMALALLAMATFGVWLRFRPIPYDPVKWSQSGGFDRGRMLTSLLSKSNFVGLTRTDVEHYLGPANFDERQFWYDLGPSDLGVDKDPRADVGDQSRLYGVFAYDLTGGVTEIIYSQRRPVLGSTPFDSAAWFGGNPSQRRAMLTRALGRLRASGLYRNNVESVLGPPDGSRIRAHYDVGQGGKFLGSHKALVLEYDTNDVVTTSAVVE